MFRKSVSTALLVSLALLPALSARPHSAHALVGAAIGNVPTLIVGASITGLGGALILHELNAHEASGGYLVIPASGMMILGLIVLDDNSVQFGPLSAEQARSAGFSAGEIAAFSEELAEINAIQAQVVSDLTAQYGKTGTIDLARAESLWSDYGTTLSPDALSAAKKIAAKAIRRSEATQQKR
jgi:hypothetical protein